jgi:hypothetical protein
MCRSQVWTLFHYALPFTDEASSRFPGGISRCSWLSCRAATISGIDVEDVVEAVALAEANSSQTQSVALSLAFSERYSAESDEEDDVHQSKQKGRHIERNRERGDEDFASDNLIDSATYTDDHFQRRFGVTKAIFRQLCSSAAAADTFMATVLSKKWPLRYAYSFMRRRLINQTISSD